MNIKPIGRFILVEEKLTKRNQSTLIIPGQDSKNEELIYDAVRTIIKKGEEVPAEIPLGVKVHFVGWAEPSYTHVTEGKSGDQKIVRLSAYNFGDVVVIEEEA